MYNCDNCKKTTSKNQPELRLVTERRSKSYGNTLRKQREDGKFTIEYNNSEGWEIVKEQKLCFDCHKELSDASSSKQTS